VTSILLSFTTYHLPLTTKKIMLAISLMRMGAKKKPFYRVVVKEKRSKRDGKYLENLGTYNPMANPAEINLKHERIQYWVSVGAQPTETVASIIKHNPEQTEEQKAAAIQAKATKAEEEKVARIEAKRVEAEKLEAERVEAAQKAEAVKAEAENAARVEAESAAKAEAAESEAAEPKTVEPAVAEPEAENTEETSVETDKKPEDVK
jgi:small subunit ribosomal protein S16